jgi:nucleoside-diphosphate kinase
MERTFVAIKPDGVMRSLIGEIIGRFEKKGLRLAAMKIINVSQDQAQRHYAIHKERPFYKSLVDFITSGPVVVMAIEGVNAISVVRKLLGKTFGSDAEPGTVRGDLSNSRRNNLVHASDAPETAVYELNIYFSEKEFVKYPQNDLQWTYDWSGPKPE